MTLELIVNHPWKDSGCLKKSEEASNENLTDNIWEVAFNELREDEKTREQCLKQFKEWIRQNKDIENCIMGKFQIYFNLSVPLNLIYAESYLFDLVI